MELALTTRWNAGRHARGETLVEEILELGFTRLELGYDTRLDLTEGIRAMVARQAVQVDSVHNFCPVPLGVHRAHPEIFTFAAKDAHIRRQAVRYTIESIRFAAAIGARVVVTHCGNIDMPRYSPELMALAEQGQSFSAEYEKCKLKLQVKREKKARKQLGYWRECLDQLLPECEAQHIVLGMENMPTWEAVPTEMELEHVLHQYRSPWFKYWHDMGHGQIRANLGLINVERWLERLTPHLAGMHVHDVRAPAQDHVMPPLGDMDFLRYKSVVNHHTHPLCVVEPTPHTPAAEVRAARIYLEQVWNTPTNSSQEEEFTSE